MQMFGSYQSFVGSKLKIDSASNSFTIMACPTYLENDIVAILTISELKQYKFEKPSDSIKIEFMTKNGDKIAKVESGITFTPHRG